MPGTREDWFPTSVWYFDHPAPLSLNALLLRTIAEEKARDTDGMPDRSSVNGWHSRDDLHRYEELGDLIRFIEAATLEVVTFQRWDLNQMTPFITNLWAIVNGQGASNTVHIHPNCFLSGVYYVQAPERCGDLFFLDPRPAAAIMALPLVEHTPWTFQRVVYRPTPGRLLLFPSWLYHGVGPNASAQERICVSFNIGVRWQGTR